MNLRRTLIRVMLWSLGSGAAVGAVAVFFAQSSTVWRIVGTCFVTALAALLMLAAEILSEKKDARGGGLLGMVLVLLEYFGALLLIWDFSPAWSTSWEFEGRLAITMSLAAPIGIAAMVLMRSRFLPAMRLASQVGIVLCALEMLLVLVAIWAHEPGRNEQRYATAGTFALFGMFAIASFVGGGSAVLVRWAGVIGATVALVVTLTAIWKDLHGNSEIYTILVTVAAFLAYLNIMLALPLQRRYDWLRFSTLAAAAVTAVCVDVAIIDKLGNSDWAERIGAAAGIVGGCGTLAIAVLLRMNRPIDVSPEVFADIKTIALICPLCRKKQTLPIGDSTCGGCGLILHLGAEVPRCMSCGYILLMNKADRCPECGTSVRHDQS